MCFHDTNIESNPDKEKIYEIMIKKQNQQEL